MTTIPQQSTNVHAEPRERSGGNYTQVPNVFFDVWVPRLKNGSAVAVASLMIRQTAGWVDAKSPTGRRQSVAMGLPLIASLTGLDAKTVRRSLEVLKLHRLVLFDSRKGQRITYTFSMERLENPNDSPGENHTQNGHGSKIDHTQNEYSCDPKPYPKRAYVKERSFKEKPASEGVIPFEQPQLQNLKTELESLTTALPRFVAERNLKPDTLNTLWNAAKGKCPDIQVNDLAMWLRAEAHSGRRFDHWGGVVWLIRQELTLEAPTPKIQPQRAGEAVRHDWKAEQAKWAVEAAMSERWSDLCALQYDCPALREWMVRGAGRDQFLCAEPERQERMIKQIEERRHPIQLGILPGAALPLSNSLVQATA